MIPWIIVAVVVVPLVVIAFVVTRRNTAAGEQPAIRGRRCAGAYRAGVRRRRGLRGEVARGGQGALPRGAAALERTTSAGSSRGRSAENGRHYSLRRSFRPRSPASRSPNAWNLAFEGRAGHPSSSPGEGEWRTPNAGPADRHFVLPAENPPTRRVGVESTSWGAWTRLGETIPPLREEPLPPTPPHRTSREISPELVLVDRELLPIARATAVSSGPTRRSGSISARRRGACASSRT